jgi:hypothetical protein
MIEVKGKGLVESFFLKGSTRKPCLPAGRRISTVQSKMTRLSTVGGRYYNVGELLASLKNIEMDSTNSGSRDSP